MAFNFLRCMILVLIAFPLLSVVFVLISKFFNYIQRRGWFKFVKDGELGFFTPPAELTSQGCIIVCFVIIFMVSFYMWFAANFHIAGLVGFWMLIPLVLLLLRFRSFGEGGKLYGTEYDKPWGMFYLGFFSSSPCILLIPLYLAHLPVWLFGFCVFLAAVSTTWPIFPDYYDKVLGLFGVEDSSILYSFHVTIFVDVVLFGIIAFCIVVVRGGTVSDLLPAKYGGIFLKSLLLNCKF